MADDKMLKVLLSLLYTCLQVCESGCPRDGPLSQVFKCLYNVTHGINGTNILAGTNTSIIAGYCEDGVFNESVECLEDLYVNCNRVQVLTVLRKLAKPQLWREGFQRVCNNLKEHAQHSTCILKQRQIIHDCLKHNDDKFTQNIQPVETWHSITSNLCRYYKGMRVCTAGPVNERCDKNVGRLMDNFIYSITPLMCSKPNYGHSSSNSFQIRSTKHVLVVFVHILIVLVVVFNSE